MKLSAQIKLTTERGTLKRRQRRYAPLRKVAIMDGIKGLSSRGGSSRSLIVVQRFMKDMKTGVTKMTEAKPITAGVLSGYMCANPPESIA